MNFMSIDARKIVSFCQAQHILVDLESIVLLECALTRYYPMAIFNYVKREEKKSDKSRLLALSWYLRPVFNGILKGAIIKDAPDIRLVDSVIKAYTLLTTFIGKDFSKTELLAIFWIGTYCKIDDIKHAMFIASGRGVFAACYVKAILVARGAKPAKRESKTYTTKSYETKSSFGDLSKKSQEDRIIDDMETT